MFDDWRPPLMYSIFSCTYFVDIFRAHFSCTFFVHLFHAHISCTYFVHIFRAHILCTYSVHIFRAHICASRLKIFLKDPQATYITSFLL